MANLSTAKQELLDFILKFIRVEKEDIDPPKLWLSDDGVTQKLNATLTQLPTRNLTFMEDKGTLVGSGNFRYQIKYRLPSTLTYQDLGIADFENVVQFLLGAPIVFIRGCSGIKSLQPSQVDYPVVVEREERQQGDWLVYLNLEYLVLFQVTEFDINDQFLELDPDEINPVSLNSLNIRTYRGAIGDVKDDSIKDLDLLID